MILEIDLPPWLLDDGYCRPAYLSVFDCIRTEISWQYRCTRIFLKIRTRDSRKYGNRDVNECKFFASEAYRWALTELSFVYICIFQAISRAEVYGQSWLAFDTVSFRLICGVSTKKNQTKQTNKKTWKYGHRLFGVLTEVFLGRQVCYWFWFWSLLSSSKTNPCVHLGDIDLCDKPCDTEWLTIHVTEWCDNPCGKVESK